MENQMEKEMEHEMVAGLILGGIKVIWLYSIYL